VGSNPTPSADLQQRGLSLRDAPPLECAIDRRALCVPKRLIMKPSVRRQPGSGTIAG
jgi:hypothetical protein